MDSLDDLEDARPHLEGYDGFISALGARTKDGIELYRKIEREYPVKFATMGKELGVRYFSYLSGNMASKKSWFEFVRIKAFAEEDLFKLNLPGMTCLFRPGLLMNRDNDKRFVETLLSYLPTEKVEAKYLGHTMYEHAVRHCLDENLG